MGRNYEQIGTFEWKGHLVRLGATGNSLDIYPDEEAGEPPFPTVVVKGRDEVSTLLVGLITVEFKED